MNDPGAPAPRPERRGHPFPEDRLLRLHGFRIALRPRDRGPIWVRDGRRYTQEAALALVRGENEVLYRLLTKSSAEA